MSLCHCFTLFLIETDRLTEGGLVSCQILVVPIGLVRPALHRGPVVPLPLPLPLSPRTHRLPLLNSLVTINSRLQFNIVDWIHLKRIGQDVEWYFIKGSDGGDHT